MTLEYNIVCENIIGIVVCTHDKWEIITEPVLHIAMRDNVLVKQKRCGEKDGENHTILCDFCGMRGLGSGCGNTVSYFYVDPLRVKVAKIAFTSGETLYVDEVSAVILNDGTAVNMRKYDDNDK